MENTLFTCYLCWAEQNTLGFSFFALPFKILLFIFTASSCHALTDVLKPPSSPSGLGLCCESHLQSQAVSQLALSCMCCAEDTP